MNSRSLPICLFFLTACLAFPLAAQTVLEIEIEGEDSRTYTLDSSVPVLIAADGSISAAASEAPLCATGCEDVQVSMQASDGGLFRINSDAQGPVEVPINGSLDFQWASRGAWECDGAGLPGTDWNGSGKTPSGTQSNVAVDSLTEGEEYIAVVRCSNGAGNHDQREISVRIEEAAEIGPEPDDRGPSQFTRADRCRVGTTRDCFEYGQIFGEPFPGNRSARDIFQAPGTYISMRIDTQGLDPARNGRWSREASSSTESGTALLTLSRHPGDFDKQRIGREMGGNCYAMAEGTASIAWKGPDSTSFGGCVLEPDEIYYLNILYTSSPDGADPEDLVWQCQDSSTTTCGNLYTPL